MPGGTLLLSAGVDLKISTGHSRSFIIEKELNRIGTLSRFQRIPTVHAI